VERGASHVLLLSLRLRTHAPHLIQAKRKIDPKDPRYDAVGSSSLREELFGTYIKTLSAWDIASAPSNKTPTEEEDDAQHLEDDADDARRKQRKERAERGLREREEKVKRERAGLERDLGRTRGAVGREEGEREFMCVSAETTPSTLVIQLERG